MSAPQGPYGQGPVPQQPAPSGMHPQGPQNPPPRLAPSATTSPSGGRAALAIVLAFVLLTVMIGVMVGTQLTWGELWWQMPRGWFNTPRLLVYGTVLTLIAVYALAGRLIARGTPYVMGLVIVIAGGVFSAWVWFVVSLFTGLGL